MITLIYLKREFLWEGVMSGEEIIEKDYEEIVVKLSVSNNYLRKLEQLIDVKRIFSSRAEAFRRALELLFERYREVLEEDQT